MADDEWMGVYFAAFRWIVSCFMDDGDCERIPCNFVDSMYPGENNYGIYFCISSEEIISGR